MTAIASVGVMEPPPMLSPFFLPKRNPAAHFDPLSGKKRTFET